MWGTTLFMFEIFNRWGLGVVFPGPAVDRANEIATAYDPFLVGVSVLIAIFGAYTAFSLAEQTRASTSRVERLTWLVGGGSVLGFSIWTMHFLGMMAWHLPIVVTYQLVQTIVSAIPAIGAGIVVLVFVSRREVSWLNLGFGGVLMGLGIGAMHYIGMGATQLNAIIYYDPGYFTLSVVLAVVLSIVSLWLKRSVMVGARTDHMQVRIIASAAVMGAAISIMHYTGMAAAICIALPAQDDTLRHNHHFAAILSSATIFLLLSALLASQLGKRLRLIPRLRQEIELRRETEEELMASRQALAESHSALEGIVEQRTHDLQLEIEGRRRIQEELVEALYEVNRANRKKSQFLAHMSHELRTPLNGILGYLSMLASDGFDTMEREKIKSILADMLGAGQHLNSMIASVLDLTHLEAGTEKVVAKPVDVVASVQACCDSIRQIAEQKPVEINLEVLDPAPIVICDPKHFHQIVSNILSNAVKYTDAGGNIRVQILPGETDDTTTIEISDNGCGIDEKDIPSLFLEFERFKDAMVSSSGGIGLGLPLARRLVELNRGRISLDSTLGRGTTIRVVLPCKVEVDARDNAEDPGNKVVAI